MDDLFSIARAHWGPDVERGVAIPEGRVAKQRVEWDDLKKRLPFGRLRIGDSFAVDPVTFRTDQLRLQNYISGAACSFRSEFSPGEWAFTTRQMPDGTVRCWRIEPDEQKGRGQ